MLKEKIHIQKQGSAIKSTGNVKPREYLTAQ